MPNKNYEKGRNKEYRVATHFRDRGYAIAQRTAGSHSPFDIIAIDPINKIIKLIQVKSSEMPTRQKSEDLKANSELNGDYSVEYLIFDQGQQGGAK